MVVDVGTWDGRGSTECAIRGLVGSGRSGVSLLSFETNKKFYDQAIQNWKKEGLPEWAKLIHGRLIDETELDRENLTGSEPDWISEDLNWYSSSPKVAHMLPEQIDMAILDGGEFSTKSEFLLLAPQTKMFILDDTATRKCRWIRDHVISSPKDYTILFDNPLERNGTMAFVRKTSGVA